MLNNIKRTETFALLLKTKPVNKTTNLMLHRIKSHSDAKLGILIPKRYVKRAVDRNTLKRLIRHSCAHSLPESFKGCLLIRLKSTVKSVPISSRAAWSKEISQLLSLH